ncbi:MAG: PilN domain-containing protein [Anaerolineales bacterium]
MASVEPYEPDALSEERRKRRLLRRQTIFLWVVAVSLLATVVPLYLLSLSLRTDVTASEAVLRELRAAIEATPTLVPEVRALLGTVAALEVRRGEIATAEAALAAAGVDWDEIMDALRNYDPQRLELTSLSQNGAELQLTGRAVDNDAVTGYRRRLQASGLFSRVVIDSVRPLQPGTPTPTTPVDLTPSPSISPTPTEPTGDPYEVDDFQPVPIFLGQPQRRTFYPVYDVDRARFLAKAGRFYRIYTTDLAPGVDTVLNVNLGGAVYTNDDRGPGTLASEVVVPNNTPYDLEATIRVANRGEYGPDRQYALVVEEFAPTITPTSPRPTVTPTPVVIDTPTATATPTTLPSTPTVPPTFTPTPTGTSDVRDPYEPDDDFPMISVGETQTHTFYPQGDVDRLRFLAKADRTYRVATSDLALGVDTVLTVTVGSLDFTNDDRTPGVLESEIILTAPAGVDTTAFITVTNRGLYGSERSYTITVAEIVPEPTTLTPEAAVSGRPPGLAFPRLWQIQGPEVVEFVIFLELREELR